MTVCMYSCLTPPTGPRFGTFFFFNDTATTEIYTLSLHDALPISGDVNPRFAFWIAAVLSLANWLWGYFARRSEEHTSELQSQSNLVCRLLLEKKKKAAVLDKPLIVRTAAVLVGSLSEPDHGSPPD